jgi:uncharacterized protein (TIGR02302 family)
MTDPAALVRRLARRRRLARLALGWEALWPALWPPLGVAGVFCILALLGLPLLLPGWAQMLLLAVFLGALVYAAWRSFRGFAWPDARAAERRMERASGLRHRPLAALTDRPAASTGGPEDPAAQALWQMHQRRAAAALRRLRVGPPHPGLAARDPRALRAALLVALVAALVASGGEAPERLRRAVTPAMAASVAPPSLRLEAWITPPSYTGAAPIFLDPTAVGSAVTVPQGSRLQVALAGGSGGVPELQLGATATPFQLLDGESFGADATLNEGARLAIRRDGSELAAWSLTVQADAPPTVEFQEPPGRAQRGLASRLPWRAADDWGLATVSAEMLLAARPEAPPLVLEIPLPSGQPREARGTQQPDLSAHPWAGLEVRIELVARDGAGQMGRSDSATMVLPERSFTHPVAQALIALRKRLSLEPQAREPVRSELDKLANAPEAFDNDSAIYLALRSARHRLLRDRKPEAVTETQQLMWETALALEEGRAERTARALADAREALREALREAQQNQPQTQEQRAELDRRIQELRDAVRRHLEALAEQLQRENAEAIPFDPQNRLMDQRELDRRMQSMRDAAREGRTEDAERELAELEEMLKALEEGRVARGQDQQRQRQRERGQQQMGVLQDMVRRQGEMLDRSHQRSEAEEQRQAQERRQQQQTPPWGGQRQTQPQRESQQGQQGGEEGAQQQERADQPSRDARQQRALRRALGELMQQFGDLTGEVPPQLGRADQAMRESQDALSEGRDASPHQQRAIRELQEGGRQMAQQMQRQFGQGQDGEEQGEESGMAGDAQQGGEGQDQAQEQGQGRDPLGRRAREPTGSADAGSDTRVPDEAEMLRTRRIQEELRRRGAERERPPTELDYIDRLLRRF